METNLNVEYANRYFTARYRVCGAVLKPLTFGHVVLLTALENKFIPWLARDGLGDGDFTQAIFVCSRSWRSAERWIRWAPWAVSPILRVILSRRSRREPWKDYGNLIAYLRANCLDVPDIVLNQRNGVVASEVPLLGFLGARFIQFGMSRDELLDTSFSLLRWEQIIIGDREGVWNIRSIPAEVRESLARSACGVKTDDDNRWDKFFEEKSRVMRERFAEAQKRKASNGR